MSIASIFKSIQVGEQEAAALLSQAIQYVHIAENVVASGGSKLAAVKAAMEQFVASAYPQFSSSFDVLWGDIQAFVNGLVALYNALGVFRKIIPAIN